MGGTEILGGWGRGGSNTFVVPSAPDWCCINEDSHCPPHLTTSKVQQNLHLNKVGCLTKEEEGQQCQCPFSTVSQILELFYAPASAFFLVEYLLASCLVNRGVGRFGRGLPMILLMNGHAESTPKSAAQSAVTRHKVPPTAASDRCLKQIVGSVKSLQNPTFRSQC